MDGGPPEFRALNNDLILDMILKNLSTSALLSCRLVNKKWNEIGSGIIKRRPLYVTTTSWKARTFKRLAMLYGNSGFPVTGLKISSQQNISDIDLESSHVNQFFTNFGSRFTQVYLENCVLESRAGMAKLLGEYLPKVEEMTLGRCQISGRTDETIQKLHMPNVRRISFAKHKVVGMYALRQILLGTPNLEIIYGVSSWSASIVDELRNLNKLRNIASLVFGGSASRVVSRFHQTLVSQPPALTELNLEVFKGDGSVSKEFEECVHAVLIASQNTLKRLALGGMQISLEDLPVVFTKLHTLEVGISRVWNGELYRGDGSVLSGLLSPQSVEKFPAVKKISLIIPQVHKFSRWEHFTGAQNVLEESFWKPGTVWSTVDTLELHNHYSPEGMKYLAQVFPNATQVIMNFPQANFVSHEAKNRKPSDVWYVRKFRSLRKLVIKDFPAGCENFHLESFLTGIPMSICKGLRDAPQKTFEPPYDRVFRPYGGLWQLRKTGLRDLEIVFSSLRQPRESATMSQATVWYGLEAIPDLRTTLRVPAKAKEGVAQAMVHLRPHVLVDWY